MKIRKASVLLAVALAGSACAENSGPAAENEVRVMVRDLTGTGVGNAQIELLQGTKSLARTVTDFSGGVTITTRETGTINVVVTPPSGYKVPDNGQNTLTVTLASGQVKDVAFVIEKLPPDPKPGGGGGGSDF